jgi:hypothetical protein
VANEVHLTVSTRTRPNFDTPRATTGRYAKGVEDLGEKADKSEARVLGMKDTVDGVATVMAGPGKQGVAAYLQGWADLASGMANFVLPALAGATKATVASAATSVRSATAATAKRAAELAGAMATRTLTIAQRALNLAMRANPIGLVVTALTLLALGLILAYQRSETFRSIVQGAFRAVKAAGEALWNGLRSSFAAIRAAFDRLAGFIVTAARRGFLGPIPWIISNWRRIIDWFRQLPGQLVTALARFPGVLREKFGSALSTARTRMVAAWAQVMGFFASLPAQLARSMTQLPKLLVEKFSGALKHLLDILVIRSPSRVFHQLGAAWAGSHVDRLTDQAAAAMRSLQGLRPATLRIEPPARFPGQAASTETAPARRTAPSVPAAATPSPADPLRPPVDLADVAALPIPPLAVAGHRQRRRAILEDQRRPGPRRPRPDGPVTLEIRSGGHHIDDQLAEIFRRSLRVRSGAVQVAS